VGDPRDAAQFARLKDLAEDPHGMFDCTHCFNCIEACPKGVAPMNQIMRLRRVAGSDHHIEDRNNGHRHEMAFVNNIKKNGILAEADLLPDSYGGKFHPRAVPELLDSLPVVLTALRRGKVTPKAALTHPHRKDFKGLKRYFDDIQGKDERLELNLYVSGYEDAPGTGASDEDAAAVGAGARGDGGQSGAEQGSPGLTPDRSPTR
jgi:succinate dehydrogenase / fumarate reductase iron-sulfur subunit